MDPAISDTIRRKLKLRSLEAKNIFSQKHPHVAGILNKKGISLSNIRARSSRLLGTGLVSGSLLLAAPSVVPSLPKTHLEMSKLPSTPTPAVSNLVKLKSALESVLPQKPGPLDRSSEKQLEKAITEVTGVPSKASLEGEHLNTTYGLIGAEQHLRRFPGDTLAQHGTLEDQKEGMAPGLGAWGYFAPSRAELSADLADIEKWYVVVQTLYLPDWNTRTRYLRNWYKYRKVIVVNTTNGKAVVGAIADSGPAAWTGKQFGGSPEVMDYLGGPRYKKGSVLVFFVDDPENKIPLGPVVYNEFN